ncbi:hypothetical protein NJT12_06090 [Flavobacterium sp. AC]|uniref:Uncharacterized protein n=1 Tax=Flavobacterium azizsancarii TaxID=2961580 RepID=A0ABT4W9G3_9FLAO|nr:hypothetical protein [Flavobacterium azizsancarii]MDA6069185.1 hypothetical protein [Flavobacterium azizsancarii]
MTKKFYILLLVTLGFLMGPTLTYAHGTKTAMSCCKKESSSENCCKKKGSKEKEHNCDKGCLGNSCTPTSSCGFSPMAIFQTENNSLFSFSDKKQNYFYSEIFISSDFRSIWLPPKIS